MTIIAVAVALVALLAPAASAQESAASDRAETGGDYNDGKPLPLEIGGGNVTAKQAGGRARVGSTKWWLALDDAARTVYTKRYRLRGIGDHIEVWVATGTDEVSSGTSFPAGDCRNDRVRITDRQVKYLIREFDQNIYPKESRVFSVPPRRNGSNAELPELMGVGADYFRGPGARIVTLIDNVRDENFYDANNSRNVSFIAGFFYSVFNDLVDRNVMTIDAFDWRHRTGQDPPHDPVPGDACASSPARPFGYEGVFAHEYQHLLEHYEDPNEVNWVNEGLSDWVMDLTNYSDPRIPTTEIGFDGHVWAFLGYLGIPTPAIPNPRDLGPENSLTWWGDQPGDEILVDYGAAYTVMEFLQARFGKDLITRLHRNNASGLAGLQRALRREATTATPQDLVHRWLASMTLDAVLDDGAILTGGDPATYRVRSLDASINWDTTQAYSAPGAPPNGADFVRLRGADGTYLSAADIDTLEFAGSPSLPAEPVRWVVDANPPGNEGDAALHSGSGDDFDRAIVREVTVPAGQTTLTFETRYEIEEYWDYGFVQVSTDGGDSWTSLANGHTTAAVNIDAPAIVKDNLPGFTGTSGCPLGGQTDGSCTGPEWVTENFDLSAYAGRDILLSFRYITDGNTSLDGWWIDDVTLGGQSLSSGDDLAQWKSLKEVSPDPVAGWTVQLVAYDDAHTSAWLHALPLDGNFRGSLSGAAVEAAVGSDAETVAAIVTYDEPTEHIRQYPRYELKINGVIQPGG